jgi:hypothetical protein
MWVLGLCTVITVGNEASELLIIRYDLHCCRETFAWHPKVLVILTCDKSLIWSHGCCNFFIQGSPLVTVVKTLNASRSDYVNWTSNRRWWTSVADLCSNLFTSTGYKCRLYCLGTFYCCWTCMYSFSLIHCVNTWLKSSEETAMWLDCPSQSSFVFTLQFIGSGPAENKLLRHDQN